MRKNSKRVIIATLVGSAVFSVGLGFSCFHTEVKAATVYEETLAQFTINETASVRRAEPNGIRFCTTLSDEAQAKADTLSGVTYGTLLLPKDMLQGELTFNTADVLNIETTQWQDEEKTTWTSVLAGTDNGDGTFNNLSSDYYNRVIAARSYIKGTDNAGNTVVYYSTNTAERSMGYVAVMAKLLDGDTSELISEIAEATEVKVVLDEELSVNQAGAKSLTTNAVQSTTTGVLTIGGVAVADSNAFDYDITYTVNGEDVLSEENGVFTALQVGSATVNATVTYLDKDGERQILLDNEPYTLTVSNNFVGESEYSILKPNGATAKESAAANTLQKIFAEATGITLPIVTEKGAETTADKYISVGETALAQANVVLSVEKATASNVVTVDNTLFIRGFTDEGTLYGVQQWLGETVGYDYFGKNAYAVDVATEAIALPSNTTYVPSIEYNFAGNEYLNRSVNDEIRQNLAMDRWYGDMVAVNGELLHNSLVILNPNTYKASNEKWYVTEKEWSWSSFSYIYTVTELCYTAGGDSTSYTSMVNTAAQNVYDAFMSDTTKNKISFSIMDGYADWCTCSGCSKVGNASDNVLNFLNDVCGAVESKLSTAGDSRADSFKVVTLAYHQTNLAPKNVTSINEHIEIWFGDSYGNYTVGLNEHTDNATIYTNLQNWSNLLQTTGNDLLLWTYNSSMDCFFAPYNSFASMRANYGIAADNGVEYMYNFGGQAQSSWSALKMYLSSKLAWNAKPTDDEWNGWISDFFAGAYGAGATQMKAWFEAFLTKDISSYVADTEKSIYLDVVNSSYFPKATLESWLAYADAAIDALDRGDASYDTYYNNIALERLSPLYLLLEIYGNELDDATYFNYASAFVAGVEDLGIMFLSLNEDVEDKLNEIKSSVVTEVEIAFDLDESLAVDSEKTVEIFGSEKAISSITYGSSEIYSNGEISLGKSGIYNVTVKATDGTTKRVKLHVANEIIENAAEMSAVLYNGTEISGYYILGNDIDYTGVTYTAYSSGNTGNGFTGTFDGMGYTVKNYAPTSNAMYSLFGKLDGATVKNVNFENVTVWAWNNSALFAQYMFNTTIENVTMTNVGVSTTSADANGGILVGAYIQNSVFRNVDIYMGSANNGHVHALFGGSANSGYAVTPATFDDVNVYNVKQGQLNLLVRVNSDNETVYNAYTGLKIYTDNGATEYSFDAAAETVSVSTEHIAENGSVTLQSEKFAIGDTYTVDDVEYTVATAGQLTVTVSSLTLGEVNEIVAYGSNYEITFTNVFAVTQIINDANEMDVVLANSESEYISGYYILGNDIDFTDVTPNTSMASAWADTRFQGTFDGRGYTIKNYSQINKSTQSLFGVIYGGTVKNVNFDNVTVRAWDTSALFAVAVRGESVIENITIKNIRLTTNNANAISGIFAGRLIDGSPTFKDIEVYMATSGDYAGFLTYIFGQENQSTKMMVENVAIYNLTTYTSIVKTDVSYDWSGLKIYSGATAIDKVSVTAEQLVEVDQATLKSDKFVEGDTYTIDGAEYTVTTAGELTATVSGLTIGQTSEVVAYGKAYEITFTNVLAVTQIINDAAEMGVVLYSGTEISGYYVLGNDIDYTGATYTAYSFGNTGNGFTGTFDGMGYTVKNYAPTTNAIYSLFGKLNGATVKNVNFENVTVWAWNNSALFAQYMFNTTIENVTMTNVSVSTTNTSANGGILVGAYIQNSVFKNVDIYMSSTNSGHVNALIGGTTSSGYAVTAATFDDVNVYNVKQGQVNVIVRVNTTNATVYSTYTGLTIYTDEGTTEYSFA